VLSNFKEQEAIRAGMREAYHRKLQLEKSGILFINGKERYVIIRDGVLMLWTGPPVDTVILLLLLVSILSPKSNIDLSYQATTK
jgi:hypothetical protein